MEKDKIINKIENNIFMAEIMLKNAMNSLHSGNVNESYRNYTNGRIKEIEKMGFKKCIIPENNKKLLKEDYKIDIIGVRTINEALQKIGLK